METISLFEAYNKLIEFKSKKLNAYGAAVRNKVYEDFGELQNALEIQLKIFAAEKASGILDLKQQIENAKIELEYFQPENAAQYYKDKLDAQNKQEIETNFKETKSNIEYLQFVIEERAKRIQIEI